MTSGPFSPDPDDMAPAWLADALRVPVISRSESRARIMQQIRALPTPRRLSQPLGSRASRWRRRGSLTALGSVLVTAFLMLATSVREGDQRVLVSRVHPAAMVMGDSAVPVRGADSLAAIMHGRFLDTMHVVDYVVRGTRLDDLRSVQVRHVVRSAPTAHQSAAAAAGSGRRAPFERATLMRVSATEWRVRALLPRDAVAVGFSVNDIALDPIPVGSAGDAL